ncbi:MAG: hypothetical protein AMXMBFR64_02810 [Myxococcales bacterium]
MAAATTWRFSISRLLNGDSAVSAVMTTTVAPHAATAVQAARRGVGAAGEGASCSGGACDIRAMLARVHADVEGAGQPAASNAPRAHSSLPNGTGSHAGAPRRLESHSFVDLFSSCLVASAASRRERPSNAGAGEEFSVPPSRVVSERGEP